MIFVIHDEIIVTMTFSKCCMCQKGNYYFLYVWMTNKGRKQSLSFKVINLFIYFWPIL